MNDAALPLLSAPCRCGSKQDFAACCAPYLRAGKLAAEPVALMRSRYTAFCLDDIAYLKKTWNPETYPDDLAPGEPSMWVSLEIIDTVVDGDEAEVEFRACLIAGGKLETLHEVSYFDKIGGAWLYHSGEFENDGAKPRALSRSEPCPCASGKLYQDCHGVSP